MKTGTKEWEDLKLQTKEVGLYQAGNQVTGTHWTFFNIRATGTGSEHGGSRDSTRESEKEAMDGEGPSYTLSMKQESNA